MTLTRAGAHRIRTEAIPVPLNPKTKYPNMASAADATGMCSTKPAQLKWPALSATWIVISRHKATDSQKISLPFGLRRNRAATNISAAVPRPNRNRTQVRFNLATLNEPLVSRASKSDPHS